MVRKHNYADRVARAEQDGSERGPARAVEAQRRREPIGARLDSQPWAATWSTFLRALSPSNDDWSARRFIRNAMGERVPSEGGYLVPERLRSQVLSYMTRAIVRPRASYVLMDSLRVPVPVLDNPSQQNGAQALGGMTFSFIAEGAAFPASAPQFGGIVLEAGKVGGLISGVPNELLEDATAFTEDFLPRIIAEGLAWFEDDVILSTGTGVNQPEALPIAPGGLAVTRATSDAVVLADLVAMVKGLHPASMESATWLVSKSANDQLLDLYYAAVGQVWNGTALVNAEMPVAPPQWYTPGSADSGPCILGFPAAVNDHQSAVGTAGDVMFCDLSLLLLGDRGEMTVEVSQKGSGFATDTANIRVRHRMDARFWPQQPVTTKTGQQVSGLVVLH